MKKERVKNKFNVLAFLLATSGSLLLLESFDLIGGISRWWPVIPLVLGIGLILLYQNQKDMGLLLLGSLIIMLSIFFLYLNLTSWRQLSRLWPIFIAIFGSSFLSCYLQEKKKVFIMISLFALLLSIAFIMIFSLSSKLLPVSLIIAGLFIYIVSRYND